MRPGDAGALAILALAGVALRAGGPAESRDGGAVAFRTVDVLVDPRGQPLAAWQVEVVCTAGDGKVVGVEGGDVPAFAKAPYHDPAALRGGRIVIAAFTVDGDPPAARFRAARLHLAETGGRCAYAAKVVAAAAPGGSRIGAEVELAAGGGD